MGIVKGAMEFKKFEDGKKLTRKQAMLAMCFDCMGGTRLDCEADKCPLFDYRPNKGN